MREASDASSDNIAQKSLEVTASASVVGVDVDGDIAVLSADTKGIAPVEWNGASAEIGDPVFALSNPGGTDFA